MKSHRRRECLPFDGPHFATLCRKIAKDYRGRHPVIVYNIDGEPAFFSELLRREDIEADAFPICVHRVVLQNTPRIETLDYLFETLRHAVPGKDVLYLDDRTITGSTLDYVKRKIRDMGAREIKAAVMLQVLGHANCRLPLNVHIAHASRPDYVGAMVTIHSMN